MDKIRITREFPWAKVGEEFDVRRDGCKLAGFIFVGPDDGRQHKFYLSELEGWFEVVRWCPEKGQGYSYVNENGYVVQAIWDGGKTDENRYVVRNFFPNTGDGLERADTVAKKIRQIFKEER
jgi:hypothetical protein